MPQEPQSIEASLALSRFLIGDETVMETLTRVSELACGALPAEMAGITMLVEGKPTTAVFTDPASPDIDAHQYSSGRGPCLDAFRTKQVVRIDSIADETRYPEFTAVAAQKGIASTMSLPLTARDEPLGALNLYARTEHAFSAADEGVGLGFSAQAAVVLANARVYEDARELNANLKQALESRATIDYAVGILMASSKDTPERAFEMLVKASQRENRKLRTIAAEIVERTTRRDT